MVTDSDKKNVGWHEDLSTTTTSKPYELELEGDPETGGATSPDIVLPVRDNDINDGSIQNLNTDSVIRNGSSIQGGGQGGDSSSSRSGGPVKKKSTRLQQGSKGLQSVSLASERERIKQEKAEQKRLVIMPWSTKYKSWWYLTVFGASLTIFTETYNIAFSKAGLAPYNDAGSIIEYLLVSIFFVDIFVNFNLAYFDEETNDVVMDKVKIAKRYMSWFFWIDVIGIFPFYAMLLGFTGELGQDTKKAQFLALVRLSRMVRLRRLKQLFDILQYNSHISLMSLTLARNFCFALVWSHFAACVMYFIAREYDFDPDRTWIGGSLEGLNGSERYLTSLYWSVVTFTTVGYGDFSPVNAIEQVWGMIYMLLNIILQAWVIGSITMLIVRADERTGLYRDALQVLNQYSAMNDFSRPMEKGLKRQLRLEFELREVADEQVLKNFPSSTRRKVLRKVYLPYLIQTRLMRGIRQQFVDSFLTTCNVEIFSPGEELLTRGSISSDLYLLVGGSVKLLPWGAGNRTVPENEETSYRGTSIADSEFQEQGGGGESSRILEAGEFINEIGFFTESPQIDTVKTMTVCKTLTMSRADYQRIAEEHPGSVQKILNNLLSKAEELADEYTKVDLPERLEVLNSGSVSAFTDTADGSFHAELRKTTMQVQSQAALTAVKDLVVQHMHKLKDDHTTRFLFAASRGDVATICHMCDQGFDPNSADYDFRTGLMVSSMKGNTDAVRKLLEYGANPNLVDMHGTSALAEATRHGHEDTMDVLLKHEAKLCLDEGEAAGMLCKMVFDGDVLQLRRLLKAKIQVNAGDYDKRTAGHIAAAEGNVAALRVLVESGADLTAKDRWGNSIFDEARREDKNVVLEFLSSFESKEAENVTVSA